ncbi:MAG TPA: glycosyltransferase family 39 protein [Kofleriaceae bacterium]|nr:glycosyltransferase family 39 protein [Kofleriaceae bacterium]
MPRPRTLSERLDQFERRPSTIAEPTRRVPRWWPVIPVLLVALLLIVRASLHVAPLDRLAPAPSQPGDPPGSTAYTGSIAIARGGPVILGFQSDTPARLSFAGRELFGAGLVKDRYIVNHGAAAIRFAAPPGARLVWSPAGRRGDPEYVPASSLSPEPPERATFDAPGTSWLDGVIALALLAVLVGTLCMIGRHRLAAVSRDTWLAMAGVVAVALVARLVGIGDQGQTWDEEVNWVAGRNYVTNLLALDFSDRSWIWNYEHPPIMKYLDGIGAQFADGFGPARVLSAIWSSLACALLVPIAARLYRFRVGVVAGLVAALLPPLVAHGQIVGHESPTVLWWTLAIVIALGVHDYLPADHRAALRCLQLRLAGVGIAIGIAIASRFVNGLVGPLCALIVVVQAPPTWRRATIGWGAVILPLAAIATFYVVWPRMWLHPIAHLGESLSKLGKLHSVEPFLGTITNEPGPHYFLVYLYATAPVGILAAVVAWLVRSALDVRARQKLRTLIIVSAWLVIPLGVMASPVRQDGVRYVMPCLLALCVMAAAGLDGVAALAKQRASLVYRALAVVLVGYLAITLVRARPYYLDYFGEQTGGAGAVARARAFETAWWGEGLDRAIAYVNDHARPGDKILTPSACIEPYHMAWFREGLWTSFVNAPEQANWIVSYAPMTRPCRLPADARQAYEVVHDGAVLAVVYQR